MKRLIVLATLLGVTSIAIAFSLITGFEFLPDPSPRPFLEGYAMAMQALGSGTNEYYCVSAKRGHHWCWVGEWEFTFDKNGMQHKVVYVAMKPYDTVDANHDSVPGPLTEVRDTGVIFPTTNGVSGK